MTPGSAGKITATVNGDDSYNAGTTRAAVELLLSGSRRRVGGVHLDQVVDTPIGAGFGASASAATSAVFAAAAATEVEVSKRELALFAHRAEILQQTGLGTVSVIFDSVGAGAITVAGEPGEAKFITVDVPDDLRLVTAYIAPYDKKDALSSKQVSERINMLGSLALRGFLSDPSLDTLAQEGERFSRSLGLESPEVKKLIGLAGSAGARYASQNMIGYSVHSLVDVDRSRRVADALRGYSPSVRVDTFEVGSRRAGVIRASRRSRGLS